MYNNNNGALSRAARPLYSERLDDGVGMWACERGQALSIYLVILNHHQ